MTVYTFTHCSLVKKIQRPVLTHAKNCSEAYEEKGPGIVGKAFVNRPSIVVFK